MTQAIKQYDVVALNEDLPLRGLVRGQVGAVVEQYSPDAFEVEFVDNSGHTYALVTLKASQLLVFHYESGQAA